MNLRCMEKGLDLSFFCGMLGLERVYIGILIKLQIILHSVGGQVRVGLESDAVRSDCTWAGQDHQLFPDVIPDRQLDPVLPVSQLKVIQYLHPDTNRVE